MDSQLKIQTVSLNLGKFGIRVRNILRNLFQYIENKMLVKSVLRFE